jgi:glycosyltransferase involved in cell wall biosynthesis
MYQLGERRATRLPAIAPPLQATAIRHPMLRAASRGARAASRRAQFADRVLNRMLLYPARVRREVSGRFDLYHLVDHSYAQLTLDLPAASTIVTCHDVDTFRSLIEPAQDPRPLWFRLMTRRILRGLRRAARVVCSSNATRDDLVHFGLVDPSRVRVVPNGIDPAFLRPPPPPAVRHAAGLLDGSRETLDILHVGNDIPRKRLDLAIEIVSALRSRGLPVRLVRVGSPMRTATRARARALGTSGFVELPFLDRDVLSAVYRRCALLLFPSVREGYGLPVVEALAAGGRVIASDIPALRESSGGYATLVASDRVPDWVAAVESVLQSPEPDGPGAAARRAHAASLTWDAHVQGLLPVYDEVLSGCGLARFGRAADTLEAAAP